MYNFYSNIAMNVKKCIYFNFRALSLTAYVFNKNNKYNYFIKKIIIFIIIIKNIYKYCKMQSKTYSVMQTLWGNHIDNISVINYSCYYYSLNIFYF